MAGHDDIDDWEELSEEEDRAQHAADINDWEDLEVPQEHQAQRAPQAPAGHTPASRPWYEHLLGGAVSAADGALLHHGGEAARGMAHAANAIGVGPSPDEAEHMVDGYARDYPKTNRVANMTMSGAAALAAPASGLAQAGVGALTSGASEYGRSGNPLRAGLAATAGGAMAGLGGWAGSKIAGLGGATTAAPVRQAGTQVIDPAKLQMLQAQSAGRMPYGAAGPGSAVGRSTADAAPSSFDPSALLGQLGRRVPGMGVARAALGAARASGPGTREGGMVGNELAQGLADSATPAKAQDSPGEDKAYATPATFGQALRVVVSAPTSGLPREAAQALQEAAMSGNPQDAAALDYQYRQRYPEYARAIEKHLKGLNGEE